MRSLKGADELLFLRENRFPHATFCTAYEICNWQYLPESCCGILPCILFFQVVSKRFTVRQHERVFELPKQ